MNDQARQKLCQVISNYGTNICSTPRTCVMVLGQQCAEFPAERDLLLKALDRGIVTSVIKAPVGGPWEEQIKKLSSGSTSADDARWAVESWAMALGKHPDGAPPAPEPVVSLNAPPGAGKTGVVRAASSTLAVAIGAAIGGAITAMVVIMVFTIMLVDSPGFPTQISGLMVLIIILVGGAVGAVAAGAGGALGWTVIQTQSSALTLTTEQANRKLRKGFMGALTGAMIGAALPGYCFGIPGILGGAFLGALGGAVSGGLAGAASGTSRTY